MSNLTIPERIAELILRVAALEDAEWNTDALGVEVYNYNIEIAALRAEAQRLALDMNL
jgi:hypothetical protein